MNKAVSAALGLLVTMALVMATAGLGCGGSSNSGSVGLAGVPTTSTTSTGRVDAALARGDGLADAKQRLAETLGLDTGDVRVSTLQPASKGADAVLLWSSGRAEVDSASGRIYLVTVVATGDVQTDSVRSTLNEAFLHYDAVRVPADLGWDDDMLATLRFRQEDPGLIVEGKELFCLKWNQYDREDAPTDGFVEVYLDSCTGDLAGFSVSIADEAPDVSGILGARDATEIAETYIYLKTKEPKIPLAANGSLILLGKTATKELTVFEDKKITRGKPVLTWVIFLSGTIMDAVVGGTVYIDATTGKVLAFTPLPAE